MPGEVNMTNEAEWYHQMSAALRERDHAVRMLQRWQTKLDDANANIQKLSQANQNTEQIIEQGAEYDPVI
jgi:hypothetical protein